MPSNFTEHYQLSQWVKSDRVKMEDFNADNAKIDAALAGRSRIKAGSYEINSGNVDQPFHVAVGFRPKAVLIWKNMITMSGQPSCHYSALLLDGHPIIADRTKVIAQVEDNGFVVQRQTGSYGTYSPEIASGELYLYIAFS